MLGQTALDIKQSKASGVPLVSSPWADINRQAAQMLRPVLVPMADALRVAKAPADVRAKLVSRPLDALLDIFDPVEDAVGRAVDRVIARKGATQNFFGKRVNIARRQPADARADASTQNLIRSFRTIRAFIVLFWTQPLELAQELLREGIDITQEVAKQAATAAKTAATAASRAAQNTWESFARLFSPVSGLGQTGAGEGAAPPAVAAAGGPVLENVLAMLLESLLPALISTAPGIALTLVENETKKDAGPSATTSTSGEPSSLQVRVDVPTARSDPLPPSDSSTQKSQSNTAVIAVAGVAAGLGLLWLLRRK